MTLSDWLTDSIDRYRTHSPATATKDTLNALGEWGEWHHPPGALSPAVRRVPWVPIRGVDRGTVEPAVGETGVDAGVESQLEALGYR